MRTQKHCRSVLTILAAVFGFGLVAFDAVVPVASAQGNSLVFVPVGSPCRVLRTQGTGQTHLIAGAPRSFFSFGSGPAISAQGGNAAGCDHPRSAEGILPAAIAANVTAVGKQASGNGNIVAYPADEAAPGASTVNYTTAANIANSTLIKLRTSDGSFALLSSFANVPAIVDVLGYFYPANAYGATGVILIPPIAFLSIAPTANWLLEGVPVNDVALVWINFDGFGTVSCHNAPLYIPDKAVVTRMTVFFNDDSVVLDFSGPLLQRTSLFGDNLTFMASLDLTGVDSPSKLFVDTTFILNPTIDLFNFYYEVVFCFESIFHRLYSVAIEFTAS